MPGHARTIISTVQLHLPDVIAVYLFGSRTRPNDVHEDSDWDIAVLAAGGGMAAEVWYELRYNLLVALDTGKVDLVDLKTSDFIIRNTVLQDGNLLFCGDDVHRIKWELASEKLIAEWMPTYAASSWAMMERLNRLVG